MNGTMNTVCQSCNKPLKVGDQVIRVQYGKLGVTAHPHANVKRTRDDDYWCSECSNNVAVTNA